MSTLSALSVCSPRRHDLLEHAKREELFDTSEFETVQRRHGQAAPPCRQGTQEAGRPMPPVVATTLTKAGACRMSSWVARSMSSLWMRRACRLCHMTCWRRPVRSGTIVFAGDFMQLPPDRFRNDVPPCAQWLQRDIYQVRGITTAVRAGQEAVARNGDAAHPVPHASFHPVRRKPPVSTRIVWTMEIASWCARVPSRVSVPSKGTAHGRRRYVPAAGALLP